MNLSKEKVNGILVVTIEEKEANLSKSDRFKELIVEEINVGERKIIVSFKNVEYLDSSFLGALVGVLKILLPLNGKLVITELNADIENLFELTRLNKIFVIKNDLQTAMLDF
ncbi:MAG: anti-anti-sigma factor [Pedobacter sp.]|jgi:anti-sigma B factor antagonist|nr:anti-anti-sigma factor [Pedobacter sp.]